MKKLISIFFILIIASSCNNKEKALREVRQKAALDSVNKVIKEENLRLERMRGVRLIRENSIDYYEPSTVYVNRKKIYAEEGDLKGTLSVNFGIGNEGSFLYFPTEKSRESFVNFLEYIIEKKNEWHSVAVNNKVKRIEKVILVDTTKYWMSNNKYGFKFTEQMTLTARYMFIQRCERRDCADSSIYIDYNETDDFSKEGDFPSTWFVDFSIEDLDLIKKAFSTVTINSFIEKEKKEEKLFE